jgi:hypothetical protein
MEARGMGTGYLLNHRGEDVILQNVLWVPGLSQNLISASRLDEKGVSIQMQKGTLKVLKNETAVLLESKNTDNMWEISIRPKKESNEGQTAMATFVKSPSVSQHLWHRRLGHLNYGDVKRLGFPVNTSVKDCLTGKIGKGTSVPFAKLERVTTNQFEIGEMVHSDYCGPMEVTGTGGAVGFWTFIDDASSRVVTVLKSPGMRLEDAMIEYIQMSNRQSGRLVKKVRCDNGSEYQSNKLLQY